MKRENSKAFTLIELLTVIAVIAVLAGILIPAVSKIRLNAADSRGANNIRQVGIAYLLAAQENGGVLPSVHGDSSSETWTRMVNAVLVSEESEDYMDQWSDTLLDPAALVRGVISESNISKWHFAPLAAITRGTGSNGSGAAPKALRGYNRLIQHPHPDRQILLADAGVDDADSSTWGDLLHGESFSWSGAWSGNVSESKANEVAVTGSNVGGDIRWMDGTAKFFFLDGHVEKLRQEELYQKNLNPLFQ
ncbi:MAG: type II secretion system protein [Puniceicoccales bacterium]